MLRPHRTTAVPTSMGSMLDTKIFGIGLSKTGTTSLHLALHLLGYRSGTYHHLKRLKLKGWFKGNFEDDYLEDYDALTDLPIGTYFADLDRRYAGSKFILTIRDVDSWLESAARHWTRRPDRRRGCGRDVRMATYGISGFDRDRFRFVYENHVRNVQWHFRDRSRDLLILDIAAGQGWPELCPFLGKEIPPEPFPHVKPGRRSRA